jgi:hypothetical protein
MGRPQLYARTQRGKLLSNHGRGIWSGEWKRQHTRACWHARAGWWVEGKSGEMTTYSDATLTIRKLPLQNTHKPLHTRNVHLGKPSWRQGKQQAGAVRRGAAGVGAPGSVWSGGGGERGGRGWRSGVQRSAQITCELAIAKNRSPKAA